MKKRKPTLLWPGGVAVPLLFSAYLLAGSGNEKWMRVLGGPVFEQSFVRQSSSLERAAITREKMADEGMACAGFVNAYQVSHDPRYRRRAKEIADFLVANSNLAGDGIPG